MAHFNAFVTLPSRPTDVEKALAEATEYHISAGLLDRVVSVVSEVSPDEAAQAVAEYKRVCVVMSGDKSWSRDPWDCECCGSDPLNKDTIQTLRSAPFVLEVVCHSLYGIGPIGPRPRGR